MDNYQARVEMLARQWEWIFSQAMTNEDHLNFKRDCEEAKVENLDVLVEMEDFECI